MENTMAIVIMDREELLFIRLPHLTKELILIDALVQVIQEQLVIEIIMEQQHSKLMKLKL